MKVIAFILSILVFIMAISPCADYEMILHAQEHVLSESHDQGHDHSHHNNDLCTPFCTCQCCGTSITVPDIVYFSDLKNYSLYSVSEYFITEYNHIYTDGVWRPPSYS